jgi:hypothetical protein
MIFVWLPWKNWRMLLGLVLSYEQKKKVLQKTQRFRDGNIGGGLVMIR